MNRRIEWRLAALKNGFQDATAYRIEFLIEVLGQAAVPVVTQLVIWYAIFKMGGAQSVGGLDYTQLVTYSLFSLLFSQIRGGDLDFELAEMVRTGALSNYLLRPVSVVEFIWIRGSAPKLFLSGICLLIGMVAAATAGLDPTRMAGAMFLALIGNIIHYQLSAALASIAFYWEEAYSVLMVKNLVVGLLSGELLHLGIFPDQWRWVWEALPFHLYVFGPTQYALGQWSTGLYWMKLVQAGAWLFMGWLMIRLSWGLGTRRYLSLGG